MTNSTQAPNMIKPWVICLWLISFCVSGTTLWAQAEVKRSVSVSTEDKIEKLEKQLATANRMRAESQFQITNLQNEIRELRGIVEEQSYQIEQLTKRQRDIFRDLDAVKFGDNQSTPKQTQPTITQPPANNDNTVVTQTEPNTSASEEEIRQAYDSIFPLVRNKQFDEAITRYQQFIDDYPSSDYISNARYWLAQIYSVQGNNVDAEREYSIVAEQYPQSSKAADALLKLGQIYESQRDMSRASNMYQKILTDYADTNAARFAQQRLDNLNLN